MTTKILKAICGKVSLLTSAPTRLMNCLNRLFVFPILLSAFALPTLANYPNNINDDEDDLLAGSAPSGVNITHWLVSEPYINLWLLSQPMAYETSYGAPMGFGLAYKQRNSRSNANMFGLGSHWECSWLTYVEYSLSGTNVTASSVWLPQGGKRAYTADGTTREYKSYSTMSVLRDGSNNVIGFRVDYPSGAKASYKYLLNLSASVNYASISEMVDPVGRTNLFQYETITGNIVRLLRMIDPDNRTNTRSEEH